MKNKILFPQASLADVIEFVRSEQTRDVLDRAQAQGVMLAADERAYELAIARREAREIGEGLATARITV